MMCFSPFIHHYIYIDFTRAFDTVSSQKLVYKLLKYGILGNLLKFISSCLGDRSQHHFTIAMFTYPAMFDPEAASHAKTLPPIPLPQVGFNINSEIFSQKALVCCKSLFLTYLLSWVALYLICIQKPADQSQTTCQAKMSVLRSYRRDHGIGCHWLASNVCNVCIHRLTIRG